jgi:hypothetical protein
VVHIVIYDSSGYEKSWEFLLEQLGPSGEGSLYLVKYSMCWTVMVRFERQSDQCEVINFHSCVQTVGKIDCPQTYSNPEVRKQHWEWNKCWNCILKLLTNFNLFSDISSIIENCLVFCMSSGDKLHIFWLVGEGHLRSDQHVFEISTSYRDPVQIRSYASRNVLLFCWHVGWKDMRKSHLWPKLWSVVELNSGS